MTIYNDHKLTSAAPTNDVLSTGDEYRKRFFSDQMDVSQHIELDAKGIATKSNTFWWIENFAICIFTFIFVGILLLTVNAPFTRTKNNKKNKKPYQNKQQPNILLIMGLSLLSGIVVMCVPYVQNMYSKK
jgi:flagellar biosynthesis/type III secretory pathway M-ring protein FliF/YscJ